MSRDDAVGMPGAGSDPQRTRMFGVVLVVMAALLGAVAAGFVTSQRDVEYQATVTLIAQGATGTDSSETLGRTVIALLTSSAIAEDIAAAVPGAQTPAQIRSKISAERPPGSSVIEVTYQDTQPDRAAQVAQALVPAFLARTESLGSDASGAPKIVPWDAGNGVVVALEPPVLRNAVIGGVLGAAVALFVLLLLRGSRETTSGGSEQDALGEGSGTPTVSGPAPGDETPRDSDRGSQRSNR